MKKKAEKRDYREMAQTVSAATAGTGAALVGSELVKELNLSKETVEPSNEDFVKVIEVIANSHDIPVGPQGNVVVPGRGGVPENEIPPCMYGGPTGGLEEGDDIDNPPCMYGGPMDYFDDDI